MKRQAVRSLLLLLVSKDKNLQQQVRRCLAMLDRASCRLRIIQSAPEWQAALQREPPRLILLDDSICPGNGPHLLGLLRHHLSEVLIIYLAAQHSLELEQTVRRLGVLYYTEKPPDWGDLGRVLAAVLAIPAPLSAYSAYPLVETKARRVRRKVES